MKLIPNILSLTRILLVPLITWLLLIDSFLEAAIIIIVVGLTDFLDGFIARKYNSETVFGFYLDAIADKVLIVSIYLILGIKLLIPLYLIILIVFRELLISGSYLLGAVLDFKTILKPILVSKINTFLQILLTIITCLFTISEFNEVKEFIIISNSLIVVVTITTIVSSVIYIIMWLKAVNNK
ncbi:CDP-alcohol phosphatidyltransferase family protein [Pelagibacterales bacterium]|nr:CDP-alcohol phosphatidyltransferase family protein [Pelagibacterales bacterium]